MYTQLFMLIIWIRVHIDGVEWITSHHISYPKMLISPIHVPFPSVHWSRICRVMRQWSYIAYFTYSCSHMRMSCCCTRHIHNCSNCLLYGVVHSISLDWPMAWCVCAIDINAFCATTTCVMSIWTYEVLIFILLYTTKHKWMAGFVWKKELEIKKKSKRLTFFFFF